MLCEEMKKMLGQKCLRGVTLHLNSIYLGILIFPLWLRVAKNALELLMEDIDIK